MTHNRIKFDCSPQWSHW